MIAFSRTLAATLFAAMLPGAAAAMNFGNTGASCGFDTLAEAVGNTSEGGTIYVRQTPGVNAHVIPGNIEIEKDVTIEGGDIDCRATAYDAPRAWLDGSSQSANRIFTVQSEKRLTLNKVRLSGGRAVNANGTRGGTIFLDNEAKLGLFNTIIEDGSALEGGGCVSVSRASISMLGNSEIRDCEAVERGGGLEMNGGTLFLLGDAAIRGNRATDGDGGNIYAFNDARLIVHGRIDNGTATGRGGGIFLVTGSVFNPVSQSFDKLPPEMTAVNAAQISNNSAAGDGGGIYLLQRCEDDNDLQVNCAATEDGPKLTLGDQTAMHGNRADAMGGAIFATGARLTVTDAVSFHENTAGRSGGAIRAERLTPVRITGGGQDRPVLFSQNTVDGTAQGNSGGAITVEDAPLVTMFAEFQNNQVLAPFGHGGAIYGREGAMVRLENTRVPGNAASAGGGIMIDGGRLEIRSIFRNCAPDGQADGVRFCSEIVNNTARGSTGAVDAPGVGGGIQLRMEGASADIRTTYFGGNRALNTGSEPGRGAAVAQVNFAGAGSAFILNAIFDTNRAAQGSVAAALFANHGQMTVRNSTFVGNARDVTWIGAAQGEFSRNLMTNAASGIHIWPAGTPGHCNLFATAPEEMPVGNNNATGTVYLGDGFQPGGPALDVCGAGPRFDIMGTRRPVNAAYDRGAVELTP